jgi:hypothetical protein
MHSVGLDLCIVHVAWPGCIARAGRKSHGFYDVRKLKMHTKLRHGKFVGKR